jgi:hypothetical protein
VSGKASADLRRFAEAHQDVDAVIQRIGLDTWDLLLIDGEGNWTREVFTTDQECRAAAEELGATVHEGWDDEAVAKRMNRRDHWNEPGGQRRAL